MKQERLYYINIISNIAMFSEHPQGLSMAGRTQCWWEGPDMAVNQAQINSCQEQLEQETGPGKGPHLRQALYRAGGSSQVRWSESPLVLISDTRPHRELFAFDSFLQFLSSFLSPPAASLTRWAQVQLVPFVNGILLTHLWIALSKHLINCWKAASH